MSASPGAVVTSLPQQTWIKVGKGRLLWYVYGTFTASTSYTTIVPSHELPLGTSQYGGFAVNVNVVVTAVSGTSPTMTVTIYYTDAIALLNGVAYWNSWFTVPGSGSITTTGLYGNGNTTTQAILGIQVAVSVGGTSPSFTAYISLSVVG